MPILSASIVPNLSLLVPGVGQANLLTYRQTVTAYQNLAQKIKRLGIETVVIVSNRGVTPENGLAINLHHKFNLNFEEFGDLATKLNCASDLELIAMIKNQLEAVMPVSMLSLNPLDYGAAVPLVYLLSAKKVNVLTIYPSSQGLYHQSELGRQLGAIIHNSPKRVALLASANLSSHLADSPLGYLPQAKGYDKKIIKGFETNNFKYLFSLKNEDVAQYYDQSLAPLGILAGATAEFKKTVKTVSYEHPQGLGLAVVDFEF